MNHSREACEYLVYVGGVIQGACVLFSGTEEIWADQCKNIIEHFRKRPTLEHIVTKIASSTVDLHHIDRCVSNLIWLLEDFEKYCPPNRKTIESLRNKRIKIHSELMRCAENIQRVDNSSNEESIYQHQEIASSASAEQPLVDVLSPEQDQNPPTQDDSGKNDDLSSKVPVSIAEEEQQNLTPEPVHKQAEKPYEHMAEGVSRPASSSFKKGLFLVWGKVFQTRSQKQTQKRAEKSSEKEIDLTSLRKAMVQAFTLEELEILCADIKQTLHSNGINEPLSLDMLPGTTQLGKAQGLIVHCEERGWRTYLLTEIRKARPQIEF